MLWLFAGILASFLVLLLAALWLPVALSSNLQGRADPTGGWAVALGVGVGPVALSAIAAAGLAPFMTCHVFGKQLLRVPLSRWVRRKKTKPTADSGGEPEEPAVDFTRIERSLARFVRGLDPVDTLLAWWEKERVFEVRSLEVDLEYSFRDVALTGQILAGLCMLSGVLPERVVINQCPSWEFEDRLAIAANGRFRLWPGRLLVQLLGFVLKQRSRSRRSAVPVSQ